MIIEQHRVVFENANRPHGHGHIDPKTFTPFPKNPIIARVFKEMGFADELGSGVKNLFKYSKIYSGYDPELIEDDIFKIIIPIDKISTKQDEGVIEGVIEGAIEGATKNVKDKLAILLKTIANNEGKRVPDYIKLTNMPASTIERYIKQLKDAELIYFSDKATQVGGYYLTDKIRKNI